MVLKKKVAKAAVATTAVATFGAAMTSLYITPEMSADIVDITWNGGNASATNPFVSFSGFPFALDMDQVATATGALDFVQWNDEFNVTGRSMVSQGTPSGQPPVFSGMQSATLVMSGDMIDPNNFYGVGNLGGGATSTGGGVFDGSGTAFLAFRETATNNVGWFRMTFTVDGPIVYGPGQLGTMGEIVTVGGAVGCTNPIGDVNLDGVVDLLDVAPFVDLLVNGGGFQCEADINEDGVVDLLDVDPFVTILTGG